MTAAASPAVAQQLKAIGTQMQQQIDKKALAAASQGPAGPQAPDTSAMEAPKEFLAGSWGDIGQFFVPGASGTLLRDLSYFPDAPMAMQWWVLIGWLALGIVLMLIGHLKAHSQKHTAVG
ncbi:hypothetical protein [Brevibacterium sp.]|uniref:hypothetical protein n=1 Tax=Brevibacterium sp. TaxID=1701 RepID=UPI0026496E77|nr:hypothetical protein [Brevibacterium sp.]MDN6605244.1 hypothetical protein [Brevibacterium sp.]